MTKVIGHHASINFVISSLCLLSGAAVVHVSFPDHKLFLLDQNNPWWFYHKRIFGILDIDYKNSNIDISSIIRTKSWERRTTGSCSLLHW